MILVVRDAESRRRRMSQVRDARGWLMLESAQDLLGLERERNQVPNARGGGWNVNEALSGRLSERTQTDE